MVVTELVGDGVRIVRIDRAERRNAIDSQTAEALHDACALAAEDRRGREIIFAPGFAEGLERFNLR